MPLIRPPVRLVDGRANPVRAYVADRIAETPDGPVSNGGGTTRNRRPAGIAAEVDVHVAAALVAVIEEADEVAAVLADRVDVLPVAADLRVERVRHPGRAIDRGLDLVGEADPAGLPYRRTRQRARSGGCSRRERHEQRKRGQPRNDCCPHQRKGSAVPRRRQGARPGTEAARRPGRARRARARSRRRSRPARARAPRRAS